MNILEIEHILNKVATTVTHTGSTSSIDAMMQVNDIIAEIRHYCQCKSSLDSEQHEAVETRLLDYLKKFHA